MTAIHVAITSVGYDDFLALTLPSVTRTIRSVTVLTCDADKFTQQVAKRCGAQCLATDAFFARGSAFNKGAALNEWLESLDMIESGDWVLVLDADIVIPRGLSQIVDRLPRLGLYGAIRRLCTTEKEWRAFVDGRRSFDSFPTDIPPIRDGKVWGKRPTYNPAGLCGYFQLWNPSSFVGAARFPEYPTARAYDVDFALSVPEQLRSYLPAFEVLHIGPPKINWNGRVSERWLEPSGGSHAVVERHERVLSTASRNSQ